MSGIDRDGSISLEHSTRSASHRRARWSAWLIIAACVAVPLLVAAAASAQLVHAWALQTADAVSAWDGAGWEVLHAALVWVVPPALLAASAFHIVGLRRAGERARARAALAVAVGSLLTVEALKLGAVPFPAYGLGGYRPLSGHVALAAAAAGVAVVASRPEHRVRAALLAGIVVVGTQFGVVASRWHTAADIVLPVAVAAAWAAGAAVMCATRPGPGRGSDQVVTARWWLVTVGLAGVAAVVSSVVTRAVVGGSALLVVGYAAVAATALYLVVLLGAAAALDRTSAPHTPGR